MLSNKSIAAILLPPLIASVITLIINWRIHRDMDGVGWWPTGTGLAVVGAILHSLEGELPAGLSILLADVLVVGGQLLILFGLCRFAGRPMMTRSTVLLLAWVILSVSYFTWIDFLPVTRTFVFSAALAAALLLQAPALLTLGRREGFAGAIVLALVYAVGLPILAWRIVAMSGGGVLPSMDIDTEGLSTPAQLNQFSVFIYASVLVVLRAYGYILLSTNRLNHRLRQTATVDVLTGLPNRRAFDEEIRRLAPRVRRDRIRYGLGLMDIDHFKQVNDTHGHTAGDIMLRHFAGVARSVLRDSDFFARVGGEEFVLVVADTNEVAFRQAAERIRQAFEHSRIPVRSGDLKATVSAGLAISAPGDMDHRALYAQADEALYRAKAGGRNNIELSVRENPVPAIDLIIQDVGSV